MAKSKKDKEKQEDVLLKEMISKEMIKKIERRIDNHDNDAMKTIRTFIMDDKEPESKPKPKKKKKTE